MGLELGGKAANIIFEDATIDQAVEGIINGIYFNQGHVCCAGSRLFVQESVEELVIQKLKDRMDTLIVGDPLDKNTDIGAINSPEQLVKIESYIELGKKEGAAFYQSSTPIPNGGGNWCRPTLFTQTSQSHKIVQEEIFGPVLAVQSFRTIDEVVDKANNTYYGLSAGVWTDKGSKIFHLTNRMRAGVIWANTYNKFDPTSPFGGYKGKWIRERRRFAWVEALFEVLIYQNAETQRRREEKFKFKIQSNRYYSAPPRLRVLIKKNHGESKK